MGGSTLGEPASRLPPLRTERQAIEPATLPRGDGGAGPGQPWPGTAAG